jgi:hypothetical protein
MCAVGVENISSCRQVKSARIPDGVERTVFLVDWDAVLLKIVIITVSRSTFHTGIGSADYSCVICSEWIAILGVI